MFDALYITLIVGTGPGEGLTSLEEEGGLIVGLGGLKMKYYHYYYYYYYYYYHYYYYHSYYLFGFSG